MVFNQLTMLSQLSITKLLNFTIRHINTIISPHSSSNFYHQILKKLLLSLRLNCSIYLSFNFISIFCCFYFGLAFILLCNTNFSIFINLKYYLEYSSFGCYAQYCKFRLLLKIFILRFLYQCYYIK